MKLDSILIQNFRNIEYKDLFFDRKFTLLIGKNGTGKTNILDATALLLENVAQWSDTISNPTSYLKKKTSISSSDFRRPSSFRDHNKPKPLDNNELLINGNFTFRNQVFNSIIRKSGPNERTFRDLDGLDKGYYWNESFLPIFSYQSILRTFTNQQEIKFETKKGKLTNNFSSLASLNKTNKRTVHILEWFRDNELYILQYRDNSFRVQMFERVKSDLSKFMYTMSGGQFKNIDVHFDSYEYDIVFSHNENSDNLSSLSTGYKDIINMVLEISIQGYSVQNSDLGINEITGIVLIDELDLSIHPQWQWNIIDALTTTFPEIQFIASSHSPIIISSCNYKVINLDVDEIKSDYSKENVFGMPVNDVLISAQQTTNTPLSIKKQFNEFNKLLENGEFLKAKEILCHLRAMLGENNSQVLEANLELEFEKDFNLEENDHEIDS